jgi:uracil-DNA glycosylase
MKAKDILFVGQAPGPSRAGEREPLSGRVGRRLARLLGLTEAEWLRHRRVNLLARWPGKKARKGDAFDVTAGAAHADHLLVEAHRFVLLGGLVTQCFGIPKWVPLKIWRLDYANTVGHRQFFCLPHPSGVNRWWNDKRNVRKAERALRLFVKSA